ncbi:CBS domain-containing protein [Lacticigenium naphthae]|uniref:CBS domain-containing protein n=1 Tax=Lacticigenium naphthae TaxID=515351 RepID=UPI000407A9BD|nr:CBS domain-containing protein [Lacticigenium naphthae]
MENAEKFLATFNRIHQHLNHLIGENGYLPFYELLERAEKRNDAVKKHKQALQIFADLRNVLVHNKWKPGVYLADPTDEILKEIEQMEEEISHPTAIYPRFKRNVITFQETDSLQKVFEKIKLEKAGHFPIYQQKQFKDVLTAKGIIYWIAKHSYDHTNNLLDVQIKDILEKEYSSDNYLFIRQGMPIQTASDLMIKNKKLEALMITENGKSTENLLGIITPSDL